MKKKACEYMKRFLDAVVPGVKPHDVITILKTVTNHKVKMLSPPTWGRLIRSLKEKEMIIHIQKRQTFYKPFKFIYSCWTVRKTCLYAFIMRSLLCACVTCASC